MTHFERFRGDLAMESDAFNPAMCFFAAFNTLGWKTCAASSSVVISVGCFLIFLGMVTL